MSDHQLEAVELKVRIAELWDRIGWLEDEKLRLEKATRWEARDESKEEHDLLTDAAKHRRRSAIWLLAGRIRNPSRPAAGVVNVLRDDWAWSEPESPSRASRGGSDAVGTGSGGFDERWCESVRSNSSSPAKEEMTAAAFRRAQAVVNRRESATDGSWVDQFEAERADAGDRRDSSTDLSLVKRLPTERATLPHGSFHESPSQQLGRTGMSPSSRASSDIQFSPENIFSSPTSFVYPRTHEEDNSPVGIVASDYPKRVKGKGRAPRTAPAEVAAAPGRPGTSSLKPSAKETTVATTAAAAAVHRLEASIDRYDSSANPFDSSADLSLVSRLPTKTTGVVDRRDSSASLSLVKRLPEERATLSRGSLYESTSQQLGRTGMSSSSRASSDVRFSPENSRSSPASFVSPRTHEEDNSPVGVTTSDYPKRVKKKGRAPRSTPVDVDEAPGRRGTSPVKKTVKEETAVATVLRRAETVVNRRESATDRARFNRLPTERSSSSHGSFYEAPSQQLGRTGMSPSSRASSDVRFSPENSRSSPASFVSPRTHEEDNSPVGIVASDYPKRVKEKGRAPRTAPAEVAAAPGRPGTSSLKPSAKETTVATTAAAAAVHRLEASIDRYDSSANPFDSSADLSLVSRLPTKTTGVIDRRDSSASLSLVKRLPEERATLSRGSLYESTSQQLGRTGMSSSSRASSNVRFSPENSRSSPASFVSPRTHEEDNSPVGIVASDYPKRVKEKGRAPRTAPAEVAAAPGRPGTSSLKPSAKETTVATTAAAAAVHRLEASIDRYDSSANPFDSSADLSLVSRLPTKTTGVIDSRDSSASLSLVKRLPEERATLSRGSLYESTSQQLGRTGMSSSSRASSDVRFSPENSRSSPASFVSPRTHEEDNNPVGVTTSDYPKRVKKKGRAPRSTPVDVDEAPGRRGTSPVKKTVKEETAVAAVLRRAETVVNRRESATDRTRVNRLPTERSSSSHGSFYEAPSQQLGRTGMSWSSLASSDVRFSPENSRSSPASFVSPRTHEENNNPVGITTSDYPKRVKKKGRAPRSTPVDVDEAPGRRGTSPVKKTVKEETAVATVLRRAETVVNRRESATDRARVNRLPTERSSSSHGSFYEAPSQQLGRTGMSSSSLASSDVRFSPENSRSRPASFVSPRTHEEDNNPVDVTTSDYPKRVKKKGRAPRSTPVDVDEAPGRRGTSSVKKTVKEETAVAAVLRRAETVVNCRESATDRARVNRLPTERSSSSHGSFYEAPSQQLGRTGMSWSSRASSDVRFSPENSRSSPASFVSPRTHEENNNPVGVTTSDYPKRVKKKGRAPRSTPVDVDEAPGRRGTSSVKKTVKEETAVATVLRRAETVVNRRESATDRARVNRLPTERSSSSHGSFYEAPSQQLGRTGMSWSSRASSDVRFSPENSRSSPASFVSPRTHEEDNNPVGVTTSDYPKRVKKKGRAPRSTPADVDEAPGRRGTSPVKKTVKEETAVATVLRRAETVVNRRESASDRARVNRLPTERSSSSHGSFYEAPSQQLGRTGMSSSSLASSDVRFSPENSRSSPASFVSPRTHEEDNNPVGVTTSDYPKRVKRKGRAPRSTPVDVDEAPGRRGTSPVKKTVKEETAVATVLHRAETVVNRRESATDRARVNRLPTERSSSSHGSFYEAPSQQLGRTGMSSSSLASSDVRFSPENSRSRPASFVPSRTHEEDNNPVGITTSDYPTRVKKKGRAPRTPPVDVDEAPGRCGKSSVKKTVKVAKAAPLRRSSCEAPAQQLRQERQGAAVVTTVSYRTSRQVRVSSDTKCSRRPSAVPSRPCRDDDNPTKVAATSDRPKRVTKNGRAVRGVPLGVADMKGRRGIINAHHGPCSRSCASTLCPCGKLPPLTSSTGHVRRRTLGSGSR